MKLAEIKIENFRGIRSINLPLDKLTVFIGENKTGKSTVLEAIRLVLTRSFGVRRGGQFTEYDFHLKDTHATPQTADPISIVLHFAEEQENEWPGAVYQTAPANSATATVADNIYVRRLKPTTEEALLQSEDLAMRKMRYELKKAVERMRQAAGTQGDSS